MSDSNVIKFKKGDIICKEGDFEEFMFEINSGTLGVYKKYDLPGQERIGESKSGFIGEMAVIDSLPRTATVIAEEDTELLKIDKDVFADYFKSHPEKLAALMVSLTEKLSEISDNYTDACSTIQMCLESEKYTAPKSSPLKAMINRFSDIFRSSKKA